MFKIVRLLCLPLLLTLLGAIGFRVIEGWSFVDCLYMSVITLTTVGFREAHPLSDGGKWFVMGYLVVGIGIFFYCIMEVGGLLLETRYQDWLERRKMDNQIKNLRDHFIVCGYGRMGRNVCQELGEKSHKLVVIDRNEEMIEDCKRCGWPWLLGDATEDSALIEAGIERAQGLATVLPSDADNVYVVLTARLLSSKIQIISRASDEHVLTKLERAGANRVVSIYAAGAAKMAQLLVNPNVEEFLEVIKTGNTEVDMAEVHVTAGAPFAGQRLADTDFRERGIIVVGMRHAHGDLLLPPTNDEQIQQGDYLIVTGKAETIAQLIQQS